MFVVVFQVQPKKDRWDDYLAIAGKLRPILEGIDGFIANERFRSLSREGALLSLSTWRDEKSLVRWRTEAAHHHAQERGRFEVFDDYRILVGEVTADSATPTALAGQRFDETEAGQSKALTITEVGPGAGDLPLDGLGFDEKAPGLVDNNLYESITAPGRLCLLASWLDAESAGAWTPRPIEGAALRHRRVRTIRFYGMTDRREAPQYYPDLPKS